MTSKQNWLFVSSNDLITFSEIFYWTTVNWLNINWLIDINCIRDGALWQWLCPSMPHQNYQRTRFFLRSRPSCSPYPSICSTREVGPASALVDIVPTISSRVLSFSLSHPPSAMAPGNLILFGAPPKMPPSALISVHTVGCAWRLLMCYVNTLPKCRRGRDVPCVPISWTSHPSRDAGELTVPQHRARESTEEN